jgi:hypothetical protein
MKKNILIIVPFALLLMVAVLWQPLVSYYMNSCLTDYCREYLKGELAYNEIIKKDGRWVIDAVSIDTEQRQFKAEHVSVEFALSPFSREIDVNITIKNPHIDIQKKTSELQAFLLECLPHNFSHWAFNINSSIQVDEGYITWHPVALNDKEQEKAVFRLNGYARGEDINGKLFLEVEGGNQDSNIFEMTVLKSKDKPLVAQLDFQEVDCHPFCQAVKGFGLPLRGWNITDGVINGKLTVIFDGDKRPQVMGKAHLQKLVFNHPEFNLRGDIQEARLDIRAENLKDGHLGIIGKVEITEDASFVLLNENVPYWEIQRLKGGVYFQGKDLAIVDIEGKCTHLDSTFGLNIEGDVRFPDAYQSSIDIGIELISPDENVAALRFEARQLGTLHNTAEIELKNIGKEEFAFVQTALSRYSPDWKNIQMLSGGIDASGTIFMQKYKITEINIDEITANRLKFEILPWKTTIGMAKGHGRLSMSMLKEDLLETINSQFVVEGGHLKYQSHNESSWAFTNISTDLRVNNGIVQKSVLKGEFAGLIGTVELDWLSPDEVIKASFNGETKGLIKLLPEEYKVGVESQFSKDHITLFANVKKNLPGLRMDGVLSIVSSDSDNVDTIAFGFDLEKGPNQTLPESSAERLKAIKELLPNIRSPNIADISGIRLRNGNFRAHHISLDKYLTPFLFAQKEMRILGNGDFTGYIDLNQMAIEYEARNLSLDDPKYVLLANKISKIVNPSNGKIQDAIHFIDFAQGTHFGLIPIRDGTYVDKKYGLTYSHVNANVLFEANKIHIADIEATLGAMQLTGDLDIDLRLPHQGASAECCNLRGTYNLGDKNYALSGKIKIADFVEDIGEFDIRLNDGSQEVGRIVGNITGDDKNTQVSFDKETHFGEIYPENLKFNMLKGQREVALNMSFKYDQLSLDGHLKPRDGKLFFDEMQLKYGTVLSLKLNGEVLFEDKAIEARAKDLNLQLAHLDQWDMAKSFVKDWHPLGVLTGSGKVRFETKKDSPGWRTDAILNTNLLNWGVKGLSFSDSKDTSCHYISDKGVTFRNVNSGLKSSEDGIVYCNYKIDMSSFEFGNDRFILDDMHFDVPAVNLHWLAYTLSLAFPETFVPSVVETISQAKSEGRVSGLYQLTHSNDDTKMKMVLADGDYHFMGTEHPLKNFTLTTDDATFKINSTYRYENYFFSLNAVSKSSSFEKGDLTLIGLEDKSEVLNIAWKQDPSKGLEIDRALGQFSGLQVDLTLDESGHADREFMMVGSVKMNGHRACNLFTPEVREKFKSWSIGNGYLLKGNWYVLRDFSNTGKLSFSGFLLGKDFELNGFQFDTLTSKFEYNRAAITINDLKISDEAGAFAADKIQLKQIDNFWYFSVPNFTVSKFKPSVLCIAGLTRPMFERPLFIKEFQLKDFQGAISDPTSYSGEGQVVFTNKSKNPVENTIFDFPADILARIGLDLAVMTPVTGTVLYEINDGNIYLKKFKDMFSERKLSKFYLSNQHISTIDFDGNLNLQIRMKQYNLLFKLAEPFAVNINGPFTNPKYRINTEGKKY